FVNLFVIGLEHRYGERPGEAGGWLDDPRDDVLPAFLVEVGQWLARECGVRREVEVSARCDTFELAPTPWEKVLNVGGAGAVVRELFLFVVANAQPRFIDSEDIPIPGE